MNSIRIRPDGSFAGRLPTDWLKRARAFVEHEDPDPWTAIELGTAVWKALAERDRLESRLKAPTRLVVHLDGEQDLGHLPWEALGLGRERPVELSAWQIVRRFEVEGRVARSRRTPRRALVLVGDVVKGREDRSRTLVPDTRDAVACVVRELRATGLEVRVAIASRALDARLLEDADFACDVVLHESADLERLFDDSEGFDLIHAHALGIEEGSPSPQAANHLQLGLEGECAHLPIVPLDGMDPRLSLRALLQGHPTRLIVLCACRTTEQLAPALLQVADHVVGMRGYVSPNTLEAWCPAFYGAVRGAASIGEAVRRGRVALMELDARHAAQERRIQWWIPAHYAASDDDRPFAEPWEVALDRYQRRELDESRPFRGPFEALGKTLDQVAVPLLVEPVPSGDRRDAQAIWEERRPGEQTLRTLVEKGAHPRLLVLGEAGSGKTTTLRQVQRAWIQERTPASPAAVHANLAAFVQDGCESTRDGFVRYVWRSEDEAEAFAAALERLHLDGRLVLLLDGLDEVTDPPGKPSGWAAGRLGALLSAVQGAWPRSRIVVAGRPTADTLDGFTEAELLPLSEPKQREVLANLFAALGIEDPASRAEHHSLDLQDAEGSLAELARIPLFLVLIGSQLARGRDRLSGLRHRFLDEVIEDLLSGEHQVRAAAKRPVPRPADTTKVMLASLALAMSREGQLSFSERRTSSFLAQRFGQGLPGIDNASSPGQWLDLVREGTGLLQLGPKGWGFWHRSFQEALTSLALLDEARADSGSVRIPRLLDLVRAEFAADSAEAREHAARSWREPIALAAGFLGEEGLASPWIDALLSDPATRATTRATALASIPLADSLAPEVIEKVLTAFEGWQEAQPVYAALSERFGQGPRVVPHLEQRGLERAREMRTEETYDRDVRIELHFLVECLIALEERAPASGASEARGKILDAIGKPDLEALAVLFSTVPGKPSEPLFVDVRGGSFLMGSPPEESGRSEYEDQVTVELRDLAVQRVSAPCFRIARTPVTSEQYQLFDRAKSSRWTGRPNLPMTEVSWYEASLFCRWLDHHGGTLRRDRTTWSFQLPSEAQWEYACRGAPGPPVEGRGYPRFMSGDSEADLEAVAWFARELGEGPEPVATRGAGGELRLYDMHGNVWEWCRDWFADRLRSGVNPLGHRIGVLRTLRGGCYASTAVRCRAASRLQWLPALDVVACGLRVVLAPRTPHR